MNKYMKEAIKQAKIGICHNHGGPFGAVIVKDGIIIGKGHNMVIGKTNPILHGEMVAIQDACKKINSIDLSGSEIYTTSAPCPMCLGAILWSNIKKIYYGCDDEDAENIGFRDKIFFDNFEQLKKKMSVELGKKECIDLFDEYSKIKDKKLY